MEMNSFIWAEKYRPNTLETMVLPPNMRSDFEQYVASGEIPHLLFYSPEPGVGKTTAAKILANAVSSSVLFINAAEESSIDTVRTKVKSFASTISLDGASHKIIILDEFERMSAAQDALKAMMEELSDNCRFILTTNYINKVVDYIKSRCISYDFSNAFRCEAMKIAFFKRAVKMLTAEKIVFDKQELADVIDLFYPDMRKCTNVLRKLTIDGTLRVDSIDKFGDITIAEELISVITEKSFKNIRSFIEEKIGQSTVGIWTAIYTVVIESEKITDKSAVTILISKYMYQDAFAIDKSINISAFCCELMEYV